MYGKQIKTLVAAMILFGANAPALKAGPGLNCDAYARAAVKHAKENKQHNCKFTGSLWSPSYNGHKNWCLSAGVKMANLTWGDRERARLINQCKKAWADKFKNDHKNQKYKLANCKKYAKKAQKLRGQLNQTCKKGGEWPATVRADRDWCMKVGINKAKAANRARIGKMASCGLAEKKAKLAKTKKFYHSGVKRNRKWLPVDVCTHGVRKGSEGLYNACGKRVADAFCITKGYVEAIKYPKRNYNGGSNMDGDLPSTWWIVSKKACTGSCTGFSSITCKGKLK